MKDSPSLIMLWESVDARDALHKRFGFANAAAAAGWVGDTLAGSWGITVDYCDRVVISAWNAMAWISAGESHLIAKWSALPQLFARLNDAASVTRWLHTKAIPTAVPIPATDGRALVEIPNDGRPRSGSTVSRRRFLLGVLPVLRGHLLDVDTHKEVADAGRMLAAVHEALAAYPGTVNGRRPSRDEQLVHNDFRSANALHDGAEVTAVLDLEEIEHGTRVADLAKAAVLLGCRYRDWGPTSADVRNTFVNAYSGRLPLTSPERRELDERIVADLKEKGWT